MIDMFTNYQNLSDYYIPNNLQAAFTTAKSYTKLEPNERSKPYELYNAKNELEGYYWYYGDELILDFAIDGEITINTNDIILSSPGEEPTVRTPGRIGTKAYNIVDLKRWTCTAHSGSDFIWVLEDEFGSDFDGTKSIFIDAKSYMKDKTLTFNIYNFRMDQVFTQSIAGTNNFKILIDKELSNKLVKGIYYCSLSVAGKSTSETIFSTSDCKLLVK